MHTLIEMARYVFGSVEGTRSRPTVAPLNLGANLAGLAADGTLRKGAAGAWHSWPGGSDRLRLAEQPGFQQLCKRAELGEQDRAPVQPPSVAVGRVDDADDGNAVGEPSHHPTILYHSMSIGGRFDELHRTKVPSAASLLTAVAGVEPDVTRAPAAIAE